MPLQGGGPIAGCHRRVPLSVLWLGGRVTNFGGVEVVPLQGEGNDQLWGSGRGAIAGH